MGTISQDGSMIPSCIWMERILQTKNKSDRSKIVLQIIRYDYYSINLFHTQIDSIFSANK